MQGGIKTIVPYVQRFIIFAKANPQLKFLVTRIGCGIAGFTDKEIAPLFADARHVNNIFLPASFWQAIESRLPQPYTRFMRMIAELHKRGHELLRLCPTLSPSGCYWRSALTTRKNTWRYCGAIMGSYEPGEGLVILSHGEMPWFDSIQAASPEEDADMFVREFPILAEATIGSDYLYVRWFQKVLDECEHGHVIYALADGDFCVRNGFMIGASEPLCFPPMGESEEQCQY